MTIEVAISVLTCLVGVGVLIMLSAIPWAYVIHGRLTKIETVLKAHLDNLVRLAEVEERILRLEMRDHED